MQDSKRQLEQQLAQLEAEVMRGGQTLASHRHSAEEYSKKRALLATEVSALLATLHERRRAYRQQKHQQQQQQQQHAQRHSEQEASATMKQNNTDAINSITRCVKSPIGVLLERRKVRI